MPELATLLWLIPALPLLACLVTAALGPRWLRGQSHWPCVIALGISFALSFLVLTMGPPYGVATVESTLFAFPGDDPERSQVREKLLGYQPAPDRYVTAIYDW